MFILKPLLLMINYKREIKLKKCVVILLEHRLIETVIIYVVPEN